MKSSDKKVILQYFKQEMIKIREGNMISPLLYKISEMLNHMDWLEGLTDQKYPDLANYLGIPVKYTNKKGTATYDTRRVTKKLAKRPKV